MLFAPASFALHNLENYISSPTLANPGFLIVDPTDGRVLGENQPDQPRVPASVLKLISSTSALKILGPDRIYKTSLWSSDTSNSFVLRGEYDPWITSDWKLAKENQQTYIPDLILKSTKLKSIKVSYFGVIDKDIEALAKYLKYRKVQASFVKVDAKAAEARAKVKLNEITSLPLSEIVKFAILWSDNAIADRIGREAALKAGNPITPEGMTKTFSTVLTSLGVDTKGLFAEDGSGLGKNNRVTARTLVSLLMQIRKDPTLEPIYDGLPIGGITGTLKNRFIKTAPNAIGHVHAKTGWLNDSVTLAGFVDDGNKEYVFAILADEIKGTWKSRWAARDTMDKLLGAIVEGNH